MERLQKHRSGAALLMVLGFMALISMLLVGLSELISYDIDQELAWAKQFEARLLAESGLALARHPQVERGDPLLQEFADNEFDEGFTVDIRSEEAFLNIANILDTEEDDLLRRVLTEWGMEKSEIDVLTDRLYDWVDDNDEKRRSGAEIDDYRMAERTPYPPNRTLQRVDELRYVMGIERLSEVKPDWADYFTVHGSGQVNVNDADAELLAIILDISETAAESINYYRDGPDGEPETDDDQEFESVDDFMEYMGLTGDTMGAADYLTTESTARRITSTGRIGDYETTIQVVTSEGEQAGQYLEYREE